jgi:plastocyanin
MNSKISLSGISAVAAIAALTAACGSSSTTTPGQQTSGTTPTPTSTGTSTPTPVTVSVSIPTGAMGMGPAAYGANPLVVKVGTTVTWTNNDAMPHTVTSDTQLFDSRTMNAGATFSQTFSTAGDFPYHCTIHGAASMSGMVRVQ